MRIPPNKVEEIFRAVDIVDVVGDYVQLKKKGQNYWGLSPFKTERTPSFSVSPQKGIYKCFSTGKGGNAVSFVMEMEGFSYPEALVHLAKKYRIEIEYEPTTEQAANDARRESLLILNKFAADFFHRELLHTDEGRNLGLAYFKERGFTDESVQKFQLGYCAQGWNALTNMALKNQFKEDFLLETGLSIRSEKTGHLYDRFHSRVMFPIHDANGRIVGFGGRIMGKSDKAAKYVNSPESAIYHKSKLLYGLFFGRNAIRAANQCILVEGYTDVISLHQAGVENAVSSSGTSLTEEQIQLIRRYTPNIVVIYDGDRAGLNAALRGIDMILDKGLNVKVLQLPPEHDPDSFVKTYGAEHFRQYLQNNATDFISFKIDALATPNAKPDPAEKARIVQEVARSVARIQNEVQRSVYAQFAAEKLHTDEKVFLNAVAQELTRLAVQGPDPQPFTVVHQQQKQLETVAQPAAEEKSALSELFHQEREILRLMLNHFDKTAEIEGEIHGFMAYFSDLSEAVFQTPLHEEVRKTLFDAYFAQQPLPQNLLLTEKGKDVANLVTELMTDRYPISENWLKQDKLVQNIDKDVKLAVEQALLHYQFRHYNRLLSETLNQMKETTDPETQLKLLTRQQKIKLLLKDITDALGVVTV